MDSVEHTEAGQRGRQGSLGALLSALCTRADSQRQPLAGRPHAARARHRRFCNISEKCFFLQTFDIFKILRRGALPAAGGAALGGAVYVAGGMTNGGQLLTSVEMLDPHTRTWAPVAPLPDASSATPGRYLHVVVAMGGQLWSIGGSNRMGALNNFCFFSGGKNGKWHQATADSKSMLRLQ